MAFDPVTFYQLASELYQAASGDDAKLRSAISRAYYAALITARDVAALPEPQGGDTHTQVINHYRSADPPLAAWLLELKRGRVKADYKSSQAVVRKNGGDALNTARKVLLALNALPPPAPSTPGAPVAPPNTLH